MAKSRSKVNKKTGTLAGATPVKTKTPLEKVLEKMAFRIELGTALNLRGKGIDALDFLEALLDNELITWTDDGANDCEYNIEDIKRYHEMCKLFGIDLFLFCQDPILDPEPVVRLNMKPEWVEKLRRVPGSTFFDKDAQKEGATNEPILEYCDRHIGSV
jgi:hypothetical protein